MNNSSIRSNKNKSNSSIKSIKYFKKRKIKKVNYKDNNKKLSLFNNDFDIKEEKIQEKNEESDISDENLEKKINEFFMKIQKLKNDKKDLGDLEFLMNDELVKDSETDRKLNSRRLNDFIEKIDNNRQLDRTIRPKFYFLSPIKFSTKDLSD